jgi:putative FmdB family regulatory protein
MPIYEYACTSCGERTEAKQGFDDPPLETCPHCGGKLRKLYSPVGIVFKGSGFYSTDQKSKKGASGDSKPAAAKSEGDSKSSDTGDSSKSDAKKSATRPASSSTEKSA